MLLKAFDFEGFPLEFYKAPNGEPVVTAASLVRALKGNANNAALIARNNVRTKWIVEVKLPTGGKPVVCLFEPGAYQLSANSMFQTELAERFQDFLFEEVLPKLRASGSYTARPEDQQHFYPFGLKSQLQEAQAAAIARLEACLASAFDI